MRDTVMKKKYDNSDTNSQDKLLVQQIKSAEKIEVEWDNDAQVTTSGSLVYFSKFLSTGGCFNALCANAPLHYDSNNAHAVRDILGTILISILHGHKRYAHINALRNDRVISTLLDMEKIVSEDSVRRALTRISRKDADEWLAEHEIKTILPVITEKHIIDIDNTVKPIYGHQEGAEIGYNPKKPGRPSHNIHTCMIGELRLLFSVDVQSGKKHAAKHGTPSLWKRIDSLPKHLHPRLIRGDVSYGSDEIMVQAEERSLKYLFKLARHETIKKMFRQLCSDQGDWSDADGGWQSCERRFRLKAWSCQRRCVFLRRYVEPSKDTAPKTTKIQHAEFDFVCEISTEDNWEFICLVTNDEEICVSGLAQLYRNRADCENLFDEIKNQWGLSGFMTRDLHRCTIMARLIALVYNWWNIFARLACREAHLEAVTSRPLLLSAVGRLVQSGRTKLLRLTSNHAKADKIRRVLEGIWKFLNKLNSIAEQLKPERIWAIILAVAFIKWYQDKPIFTALEIPQFLIQSLKN